MVNKITEKFFTQKDFSKELQRVLLFVVKKTDFIIKKEIWRGIIYDQNKVGSIIFDGVYQKQPAILKLQGLKPELDEIKIYKLFEKNNKSSKIRLPKRLAEQKWNKKMGFGYLVQEKIIGVPIFKMPHATKSQMQLFAKFYNEYRSKTAMRPFWNDKIDSQKFFIYRLDNWIKICRHKKLWDEDEMASRVDTFKKIILKEANHIPFLFSHGHLTANDIYIQDKKFVLLSNLFWSWRPKYYDLTFNIWACLFKLQSNVSLKKALQLINDWKVVYKKIPWVKSQNDFDKLFNLMLLERLIGTIVIDLGLIRKQSHCKMKKWKLHLKLFDYFLKNRNNE